MVLKTMYPPQKDSPTTFLLGDISSSDTIITLGNAAILPNIFPYPLTLGIDKTITETVMVSSVNLENNQITVIRTPGSYAWPAGTKVARVFTASDLTDIQENIQSISESVDSANSNIELLDIAVDELEAAVGDSGSGLVKELADEVVRATAAEQAETLRATTAENAIDAAKVNRTELSQVITDWSYSADGTKLLVTITRYNASNQQTSQFTKIIPAVTDETIGMMTPEAYNEISALRNDVMALQQQGGRFIGISFNTKSALDSYVIPESVKLGDFTYVLDDETKEDSTTRYVFNGSSFDFAFVVNYDPVGLADSQTPGLVKSNDGTTEGRVFVETNGEMSVIGWDRLSLDVKALIDNPIGIATTEVPGLVRGTGIIDWTEFQNASDKDINSVCYFDLVSSFIAVGADGTIMASNSGVDWESKTSPVSSSLFSVGCSTNLLVAVGAGGAVVSSPNGEDWTLRTGAGGGNWRSVCYGGGTFVAVGDNGTIMTSSNGTDWVSRTSPVASSLFSVCHAYNSLFIAVGADGAIISSPDGVNWTAGTGLGNTTWRSVCYNGLVTVVGDGAAIFGGFDGSADFWIARPDMDGIMWRSVQLGNILSKEDELFLMVAVSYTGEIAMTSDRGQTWLVDSGKTGYKWLSNSYGDGYFVAVGSDGASMMADGLPRGKVFVDKDGKMSVGGWEQLDKKATDALPTTGGSMTGALTAGGLQDELIAQVRNAVIAPAGTVDFSSYPNNCLIFVKKG